MGELEDSWDYESIRDTEDRQKESQQKLLPILREKLGDGPVSVTFSLE